MQRAPNFDPVARIYRWAEYLALGPLLQRTRTHFLPQLADRRRALVLGDGDGRFLAKLLAQNPTLHATAVDTSEQMLKLLRARCDPTRVQTIQGDALTVALPPGTDLIVTHFFLDCFTQSEINGLALRLTQPGALWLVSDFHADSPFARAYVRSLYFAFRILTGLRVTHLSDPAAALTAAGFHRIAQHQILGGLVYTELWACP
jgi:SAM-dependent methyltransferase